MLELEVIDVEVVAVGSGREKTVGPVLVGRLNTLGAFETLSVEDDTGGSVNTSLREKGLFSPGGAGVNTLGGLPSSLESGLRTPLLGVLGREGPAFSFDLDGGMAFSFERGGGGGIGSFAPRTRR